MVLNDPGIVDHEPAVDEELEEHSEEDLDDEMVWQDSEYMEGGDEEIGSFVADEVIEPDLDVIESQPIQAPAPVPRWGDQDSEPDDGANHAAPRPERSSHIQSARRWRRIAGISSTMMVPSSRAPEDTSRSISGKDSLAALAAAYRKSNAERQADPHQWTFEERRQRFGKS